MAEALMVGIAGRKSKEWSAQDGALDLEKPFGLVSTRKLCPICQQGKTFPCTLHNQYMLSSTLLLFFHHYRVIENYRIEKSAKKLSFLT